MFLFCAHTVDVMARINGAEQVFEADWLWELLKLYKNAQLTTFQELLQRL